jgi:hypothetical protein
VVRMKLVGPELHGQSAKRFVSCGVHSRRRRTNGRKQENREATPNQVQASSRRWSTVRIQAASTTRGLWLLQPPAPSRSRS